jgi:4'-phosphopantetheinyl transferase EntD
MTASSYARLAGAIFAVIALLQLVRALAGWPISIGGVTMPVWPSWIAFVVAGALACLGFTARP